MLIVQATRPTLALDPHSVRRMNSNGMKCLISSLCHSPKMAVGQHDRGPALRQMHASPLVCNSRLHLDLALLKRSRTPLVLYGNSRPVSTIFRQT
jgi:hypothetical protein